MSEAFDVKDLMDLPVSEEMQKAIDEAKRRYRQITVKTGRLQMAVMTRRWLLSV